MQKHYFRRLHCICTWRKPKTQMGFTSGDQMGSMFLTQR
ncbi:hypothetical protein Gotur_025790 [Gossypium turneri]